MADVFISYANPEDVARARAVANAIAGAGFKVWLDLHIRTGHPFGERIQDELDSAKCVVVLWSHTSVKSRWVREEARQAAERGILVPILIDAVPRLPLGFGELQTVRALDPAADLPAECLDAITEIVRGDGPSPVPEPPAPRTSAFPQLPRQPADDSHRPAASPPLLQKSWSRLAIYGSATILITIAASWLLYRYSHQPIRMPPIPHNMKVSIQPVFVTAPPLPLPDPMTSLNERSSAIQQYLRQLDVIATSRFPDAFWGPIDQTAIANEKRSWADHLVNLSGFKDDCAKKTLDQEKRACVQHALSQVPAPKPLPTPGRVFQVTEQTITGDRIDLHQPVSKTLIERNTYTKPATVFVKGEWGGLPSLPCADIIVASLEFRGTVSAFTLYDDKGRQTAAKIVGHDLPPARQNPTGAGRTGGDLANLKDLAVMNGWPARTPLSVTFQGARTYGKNSTACTYDHPYVLIWQNDRRINGGRDPYEVRELLNQ